MKKLIVGIFILCCVGFVYADVDTFDGQTGIDTWDGQTGIDTVDGQGVASGGCGGSCDTGNNEVGDRADLTANTMSFSAGWVAVNLSSADCSGGLEGGYLEFIDTNDSTAKVCVYSDDGDSTPDAGDLLIACSSSISSGSSAGVKGGDNIDDCAEVTNGSAYWIVIAVDDSAANPWDMHYSASGTGFIDDNELSGFHDSPPANLGGVTWSSLNRHYEIYATIK